MMWFPWIMVALVAVEGIVITWLVRIHEGRWERREAELKAVVEETLTNMIRHFGAVAEHEKVELGRGNPLPSERPNEIVVDDAEESPEPTCYLCPHCEHHFSLFPEIGLQKIYCPKCSKALYGMLEVPEPPHDAEPPVILDPSGRIQISCIHCDLEFFVDPGCNLGTTFCPHGCGRQGPAVGKPTEEEPTHPFPGRLAEDRNNYLMSEVSRLNNRMSALEFDHEKFSTRKLFEKADAAEKRLDALEGSVANAKTNFYSGGGIFDQLGKIENRIQKLET